MKKPIVFIDVETTGGTAGKDRITEIGIVRIENGKKVAEYQSLVNPGTHIPYFIQRMTGINQKMVEAAPPFEEVKHSVRELLDGAIFAAHNAQFDYSFIRSEFARLDDTYKAKVLCTVRLSRVLYPQYKRHSLGSLITRFALDVPNHHRAFDDAQALWEFYGKARDEVGQEKFSDAIDRLLSGPQLPAYLKQKKLGPFPETPGIYRFYGRTNDEAQGELLYIGKSTSLKKRIFSHFTAGNESQKDIMLSRFVKDITITKTAGELGALLLEAHEIKKDKPLLNRSLRKTNSYSLAILTKNNDYDSIEIKKDTNINPDSHATVLASYSSEKSMQNKLREICDEYTLCPKLLGLEKTGRACFSHQIGKCKGACVGKENSLKYNLRFAQAFANSKVNPWPFDGMVAYEETTDEIKQRHLFLNWCHVATLTYRKDIENPEIQTYEYKFDWDIYKILKRFIKHTDKIKELSRQENNLVETQIK